MGFMSPKIPPPAEPDPALNEAKKDAAAKAAADRKVIKDKKDEEQRQFAGGFRGQRSLLSAGFTGFSGRSILTRKA